MTILFRLTVLAALIPWMTACSSYSQIKNTPLAETPSAQAYSIQALSQRARSNDTEIMLAFSGGGTRAAALSYGVLEALRDTVFESDGKVSSLLDVYTGQSH